MLNTIKVLIVIICVVVIFFKIPYSKTRTEFNRVIEQKSSMINKNTEVFTENDIKDFPVPVQRYLVKCGYMGRPKMNYMKAEFKNVDFKMSPEKTIKIDYTQYNFVNQPDRFALIDSSLYGIPFEGFDSYNDGVGSMKGSIAKMITLFDQRGVEMDKACLVTFLAECLIVPNVALQDYVVWEEIDETHAKATISYYGISASGIFTFDEDGLWQLFETNDRVATSMDGTKRDAKWSAIINDYKETNGILQPRIVQSIWHYPEGDSIYFNENMSEVSIVYY